MIPTNGESARLGDPADLPFLEAIAERQREVIPELRGGPVYLIREDEGMPLVNRFTPLLSGEGGAVVVGTYDDVVFGFAAFHYETLSDDSTLARVTDLIVEPEARESGIGEAMMNLVVELATAAGCFGIDALALPGDRHTKNFFESFGLKARLLTVHRSLQTPDPSS